MNGAQDAYQVDVQVSLYRKYNGGDRMSLSRSWELPGGSSTVVFRTLAEFSEIADQMQAREEARRDEDASAPLG